MVASGIYSSSSKSSGLMLSREPSMQEEEKILPKRAKLVQISKDSKDES